MTDTDLRTILSLAGQTGANVRLATMDDAEKTAMTEKARAAKAARYFERLKDIVDPNGELSEEERTRRATHLLKARQAKARLDAARRERNRKLLTEQVEALIGAEAS